MGTASLRALQGQAHLDSAGTPRMPGRGWRAPSWAALRVKVTGPESFLGIHHRLCRTSSNTTTKQSTLSKIVRTFFCVNVLSLATGVSVTKTLQDPGP